MTLRLLTYNIRYGGLGRVEAIARQRLEGRRKGREMDAFAGSPRAAVRPEDAIESVVRRGSASERRHRLDVGCEVVRGREPVTRQLDGWPQDGVAGESPEARVSVPPRSDGARDVDRHRAEEWDALVTVGTQTGGVHRGGAPTRSIQCELAPG